MTNITHFLRDIARSIGFLSRLPVPARFFESHDRLISHAVGAFPAAGIVIAAGPAVILALLLQIAAEPLLPALLALAALTLVTGALHEDGLADAADGLGGGRDREHALSIMKDSRTGSYGVVALVLSLGLRAAALAALAGQGAGLAAAAMMAVAGFSRALMVAHWHALPSARSNGVAAGAGRPTGDARNFALASAAVIALLLLLPAASPGPVLAAGGFAALAAWAFTRLAERKIGGHTGDTIGATQQVGEIVFLASLALAV